jgi:hypothetical protein
MIIAAPTRAADPAALEEIAKRMGRERRTVAGMLVAEKA